MKKEFKLFICLILSLALIGCGKEATNNSKNTKSTNNSVINNKEKEKSNLSELEEFVEKNKASIESLSNDIIDATIIARNDSLVYFYTYKTTYDKNALGSMKTALEKSINGQADVFNSALKSIKLVAPDTKSVIVEYYNGDGTLITSIEFK